MRWRVQALLNSEILMPHQSTATLPGRRLAYWACTQPLDCQVWGRQLARDGTDWLLALVNLGSGSHSITAKWSDIGWGDGGTASVRDLWAHSQLSNATKAFTAGKVPAHGTVLVRVTQLHRPLQ